MIRFKKGLAVLLSSFMLAGAVPSVISGIAPMTVFAQEAAGKTISGFVIGDPVSTVAEDGKITVAVEVLALGSKVTLTTKPSDSGNLDAIKGNLKKGNLVDFKMDGDLVVVPSDAGKTFNRILAKESSVSPMFDTMKYGYELSPADGKAGNMVAAGWVYGKTEDTITVGDGRVVAEDISGRALPEPIKRYEETYKVAENAAVYNVNTEDYSVSAVSDFESIPVTADYNYTTTSRQAVYVVFDKNFEEAESAKVTEIYYFTPQSVSDGLPAFDVPNMSTLLKDKGIEPVSGKPYDALRGAYPDVVPYTRSTEPFEIIENTFYFVGDNEVAIYLFNTDMGTEDPTDDRLIMFDSGWPNLGYQYWKNIEAVGFDPRKITDIFLTHGHMDHYGTAVELITMIENAGGSVRLYGTKEDTFGLTEDAMGNKWNIKGALPDEESSAPDSNLSYVYTYFDLEMGIEDTIRSKTIPYEYDKYMDFGNVQILATPTPGHTPGTASFIFKTMNPVTDEWTTFGYMGGYGFNGLYTPNESNGFLRLNFQLGLAWLQQMVDVDYVAPQHTNQYPIVDVYQALKAYNNDPANKDNQLTMMDALTKDEFINFCEKRYSVATNALSDVSDKRYKSIETSGPFKPGRENGLKDVKAVILDDGKIIQGFNKNQNVNEKIPLLKNGIQNVADSYTHDPEGWYVQFYIDVLDGYQGYLPDSGPVESMRPAEGAPEILRTQRLSSKADAEAILSTIEKGGTYYIDLTKASAIVVPDDITKTFTLEKEINYTDVSGWAKDYVYDLAKRDIISGKADNLFAPEDSITRAEFTAMLARMSNRDLSKPESPAFSDINKSDWFAEEVAWAKEAGIVLGANGKFAPDSRITRQDIAVMISRYAKEIEKYDLPEVNPAEDFEDDNAISEYAKPAVIELQQAGIISGRGDNMFAPQGDATRAETAKMLSVLLKLMGK